jgi:hypothetical protein
LPVASAASWLAAVIFAAIASRCFASASSGLFVAS